MNKIFLFLVSFLVASSTVHAQDRLDRAVAVLRTGGSFFLVDAIGRYLRDRSDINRLFAKTKKALKKGGAAQAYDWGVGSLRMLPHVGAPLAWGNLIHAATTRKYFNLNKKWRIQYLRGIRRLTKKEQKKFSKQASALRKLAVIKLIGQLLLGGTVLGNSFLLRGIQRVPVLPRAVLIIGSYLTDLIASIKLRNQYKKLVEKILKKGKRKHHPADDRPAESGDDHEDDEFGDDELDALEKELALYDLENSATGAPPESTDK